MTMVVVLGYATFGLSLGPITGSQSARADNLPVGTDLGGLVLDQYCYDLGYDHSAVLTPDGSNLGKLAAFKWACIAASGSTLPTPYRISQTFDDMYLPCEAAYPGDNAVPVLGDPNDAYTWTCAVGSGAPPGGYITGRVCASNNASCIAGDPGGGISGAPITACTTTMPYFCSYTLSGTDGYYTLGDLPAGLFDITADPPLGTPASSDQIQNVTVGTSSNLTENFTLPILPVPTASGVEGAVGNPPTISGSLSSYTFDTFGCPGGTFSYSLTLAVSAKTKTGTIPAGTVLASGPMTQVSVAGGVAHFQAVHSGQLDPAHGKANLLFTFNCPGLGSGTSGNIPIYIDPSGVVVNQDGRPVAGATVTLYYSPIDDTGPYSQVANGSSTMSPGNRNNPVTTGPDGTFGWDVLPGYYKVIATRPGCTGPDLDSSPALTIPPAVTNLTITLQCSDTRQPVAKILLHPDEVTSQTSALFVVHGFKPANGNGKGKGDDQNSRAADAHFTYQCKLDNGVFTDCNGVVLYNGLTPGTHTFVVHATNEAGNTSSDVSYRWKVVLNQHGHH